MPGAHNWQNAAIAYAAVRPLVVDPARDCAGDDVRFRGLHIASSWWGKSGGCASSTTSKATNADAAARALACYDDIYWIAGGKAKAGGIESLAPYFGRIKRAYLIGDAMDAFAATLGCAGAVCEGGTLEGCDACGGARTRQATQASRVVLLSPACASFDQFRDFEQRGTSLSACLS